MRAIACLALGACAWDPPRDPGAAPPGNVLRGDVVLTADGAPSEAWITLFAADDLGPPFGTGAPTTFTVVGAGAFTGGGASLRAARWTLTGVPDGAWSVAALVDRDHDFHPLVGALAGATCGDVVGAHVISTELPVPAALEVAGGELVDDVTVLAATALPTERPVFTFAGKPTVSRAAFAGPIPPVIRLAATSVVTAFAEDLPLSLGPACDPVAPCAGTAACACVPAPCGTALWVELVDADGDGLPDPYPAPAQAAAGLPDIWPRVYLSAVTGSFVDDEGTPHDEQYVAEAFPLLAELGGAAAQGLPPSVVAPVGAPFPAAELSVTLVPSFRHYHADGADGVDAKGPYDEITNPATVPDGPWSVTVISATGQTWTVPNEAAAAPALDPSFDPATQGAALSFGP